MLADELQEKAVEAGIEAETALRAWQDHYNVERLPTALACRTSMEKLAALMAA